VAEHEGGPAADDGHRPVVPEASRRGTEVVVRGEVPARAARHERQVLRLSRRNGVEAGQSVPQDHARRPPAVTSAQVDGRVRRLHVERVELVRPALDGYGLQRVEQLSLPLRERGGHRVDGRQPRRAVTPRKGIRARVQQRLHLLRARVGVHRSRTDRHPSGRRLRLQHERRRQPRQELHRDEHRQQARRADDETRHRLILDRGVGASPGYAVARARRQRATERPAPAR
jgi:hypothetical protein